MDSKNNRYHCKICNKIVTGGKFNFKCHLYGHKAIQPRFKCSVCPKEYYRSDEYARHVKSHTAGYLDRRYYICDYCDRRFIEKRNLIFHLKVHDENLSYPYKCMACNVSYCEERLLKYHIRKTHFNLNKRETIEMRKGLNETWIEKVQDSKICVQMTKTSRNVICIKKIDAMKSEVEEKPKCDDVQSEFKEYMSSVFAHTDKSQYSKATCDYCKKQMLKKSLLPHIRERHLKLRKFKCDVCEVTFMRHYQLVGHKCGRRRKSYRYQNEIETVAA